MEAILLEYAWVLVVLIALEGLLAADNAVVMAVMVKHLPKAATEKSIVLWITWCICLPFCSIVHDYVFSEHLANTSFRSSVSLIHIHQKLSG